MKTFICDACQQDLPIKDKVFPPQAEWCNECAIAVPIDMVPGTINQHNRLPMFMAPEQWTEEEKQNYFISRRTR